MKYRFGSQRNYGLQDLEKNSANSCVMITLMLLSEGWRNYRIGYIAGGTAAERLELKTAYLNDVSMLDTVSLSALELQKAVEDRTVNDKLLCSADIVVVDDLEQIFSDYITQGELYNIVKHRIEAAKLTVFFADKRLKDVPWSALRPELLELIKVGSVADLHRENKYETLFFSSSFEQMLRETFFMKNGSPVLDKGQTELLANFLLQMSEFNHAAGVWYVALAMRGIAPFSVDVAMDLLLEEGEDTQYSLLLSELADETDVSAQELAAMRAKPLLIAAQRALETLAKERRD